MMSLRGACEARFFVFTFLALFDMIVDNLYSFFNDILFSNVTVRCFIVWILFLIFLKPIKSTNSKLYHNELVIYQKAVCTFFAYRCYNSLLIHSEQASFVHMRKLLQNLKRKFVLGKKICTFSVFFSNKAIHITKNAA